MTAVMASLPAVCQVCEGRRAVFEIDRRRARGVFGIVPCPHCSAKVPLPIYVYPTRTDQPRGAA